MNKFKKKVFIIVFAFFLITESKAVIKDKIFATVGDKVITKSDVIINVQMVRLEVEAEKKYSAS